MIRREEKGVDEVGKGRRVEEREGSRERKEEFHAFGFC